MLRSQRLELDELEPRRLRLEALAAALPGRRLELQLERDPGGGDADRREPADERPHALAQRAARPSRPELVQPFRAR